jgi:Ni2+-binding GTPase involved in maturation of urease and hydrogenase
VRRLNPEMPILRVSCRTGEGVSEWTRWLLNQTGSTVMSAALDGAG